MWRLLVVLALCGISLVQGENHAVSCSNITALQNVSLTELQGTWVSRRSVDEEDYDVGSGCYTYEISDTSDTGMTMKNKYRPRGGEESDGLIMNLRVIGDNKGRFSVKSKQHLLEGEGMEMFLLSADPSSYLVLALCRPPNDVEGPIASDPNIERFVGNVFFLARMQESDGNISEENLTKIVDQIIETLGLQSYHKKLNNANC